MNERIYGFLGEGSQGEALIELHRLFGLPDYDGFNISREGLAAFMKSREFDGLSVSPAYKRLIMPMLSKVSELARRVGVSTVVKLENGRLYGDNTEVYGILTMLELSGVEIKGKRCLVLGDALSVSAVKAALEEAEAKEIVCLAGIKDGDVVKCEGTEIVINTIPDREFSKEQRMAVLEGLSGLLAVFDLSTDPINTKFILDASMCGIKALNGLSALCARAKREAEMFSLDAQSDVSVISAVNEIAKRLCNIVLIGASGCKNTEIGASVAQRLERKHIDIDSVIEKLYGKNPEQMIRKDGETEFRRAERVAAEWAGKRKGLVISAGEGIVDLNENYYSLAQNGIIIFLNREGIEDSGDRLARYRVWCDVEIESNGDEEGSVNKILGLMGYGKNA